MRPVFFVLAEPRWYRIGACLCSLRSFRAANHAAPDQHGMTGMMTAEGLEASEVADDSLPVPQYPGRLTTDELEHVTAWAHWPLHIYV